ncbi:hypothetical protein WJX73_001925 [Symbiochloris irregularis]|uniref:Sphingomyelin synthase-like domain-containing protein n=1 Tax=Symbiochloris irregularis TaxID=706552 RepID=A0AAW1NY44_9CHLO
MIGCPVSAGEIWRRIRLEFTIELPLLKDRYKTIIFGVAFQYVHGIFTQLAHRMHRPQEHILHDLGFEHLPELGLVNEWVSELIFGSLFTGFMLWSFSPFIFTRKRFYTAVLFSRLLMVLVICQSLRIISFTVTQLPAPNYHCHLGKDTAVREWPRHWSEHLVVNLSRQVSHGCGDLIFSSHVTFTLVGCLTYNEYGSTLLMKALVWSLTAVLSLLIVASRKHYSVDVVVAWYAVPLVFWMMHRRWTTKRPPTDEWPHRPLIAQETELAEVLAQQADLEAGQGLTSQISLSKTAQKGSVHQNSSAPSTATQTSSSHPAMANGVGGAHLRGGAVASLEGDAEAGTVSGRNASSVVRPRSLTTLVNAQSLRSELEWDPRDEEREAFTASKERTNKMTTPSEKLSQLSARVPPSGCVIN